jgi:hypothetical protein
VRDPDGGHATLYGVGVVLAVLTVLVVLWVAQVPSAASDTSSFTGQVKTTGSYPCAGCRGITAREYLPARSNVTVQWSVNTGGVVKFGWTYGNNSVTWCGPLGRAGACYVASRGGNYTFQAVDAVSYQSAQVVEFAGFY